MAKDDDLAFYKSMTPAERTEMAAHHRKYTSERHAEMMEAASQDKNERDLAFGRRNTERALSLFEQGYAQGMNDVVLPAIFLCSVKNLPFPEWLTKAFCLHYLRGFHGKLKTWDDVWGRPRSRAKYEREFRKIRKPGDAYDLVMEAHSQGEPITDELFEKIGREYGIGGRETTKKKYAAVRRKRQKSAE